MKRNIHMGNHALTGILMIVEEKLGTIVIFFRQRA